MLARTVAAVAAAELMVSVELNAFVEDTVTAEKLHVAPAGRPLHVKVTAESVVKPFCAPSATVVVVLPPDATVTAFGVTANVKSGMGAPTAGTNALTWIDGDEVPLESTASTT